MSKENKPLKAIDADFVSLELDRLELNEGQLDGLPANPREILETKLDLLKKDIQAYPELMKYRMLLVYPLDNGKYIIIGHARPRLQGCPVRHHPERNLH